MLRETPHKCMQLLCVLDETILPEFQTPLQRLGGRVSSKPYSKPFRPTGSYWHFWRVFNEQQFAPVASYSFAFYMLLPSFTISPWWALFVVLLRGYPLCYLVLRACVWMALPAPTMGFDLPFVEHWVMVRCTQLCLSISSTKAVGSLAIWIYGGFLK